MRITILAYAGRAIDETFAPVVGQAAAALRKGGHRVSILGVRGDIGKLISGLKRRQPELVFNLMDGPAHDEHDDVGVVGLLDLLGLPHTSGGPGENYIQQDWPIARKLLNADEIASEAFHSNGDGRMTESLGDRGYFVGVLGNGEPTAFPPVAAEDPPLLDGMAPRTRLLTNGPPPSHEWNGKGSGKELAEALKARLQSLSVDAYHALRMRDYGRVNLRVSGAGHPSVVGVHANCDLEQSGEFAKAAAAAGIEYVTLVNRIADLAMERGAGEPSAIAGG
jgi:D-alanine-D-alanine ligase